uniref:Uncharacterized protein n=1 Tax=Oryza barthii TaxID=65489 RepID=A0A679BC96_9ORYZ|nr:hypothetical protein [Oryza barthii]
MNSCLAPLRNQSLDGPTRQHSQQKSELHTGDQEHKNINRDRQTKRSVWDELPVLELQARHRCRVVPAVEPPPDELPVWGSFITSCFTSIISPRELD